jgi:predicted nuclease of predicted toxin-antitoxin system
MSLDMSLVRALRRDGHDVLAVAETSPGTPDEEVVRLAQADDRIVLTEDRDFGRLVYAQLHGAPSSSRL